MHRPISLIALMLTLFVLAPTGAALAAEGATVAVLPFANNSLSDREALEPLRTGMQDLLITNLAMASGLTVVERAQLTAVVEEIGLAQTGLIDTDAAARVGKLLGAQAVILGGFMAMGKNIRVDARIVKVETGEVLLGAKVSGATDQLFELVDRLSVGIAGALKVRPPEASDERIPVPKAALLAYGRGLALQDAGDRDGARAAFREALELAPTFELAKQHLAELEAEK